MSEPAPAAEQKKILGLTPVSWGFIVVLLVALAYALMIGVPNL
ncbi:MAG: hypothetical protein ACTSUV_03225 [Candidatus Ranarchaeia archaeon]